MAVCVCVCVFVVCVCVRAHVRVCVCACVVPVCQAVVYHKLNPTQCPFNGQDIKKICKLLYEMGSLQHNMADMQQTQHTFYLQERVA